MSRVEQPNSNQQDTPTSTVGSPAQVPASQTATRISLNFSRADSAGLLGLSTTLPSLSCRLAGVMQHGPELSVSFVCQWQHRHTCFPFLCFCLLLLLFLVSYFFFHESIHCFLVWFGFALVFIFFFFLSFLLSSEVPQQLGNLPLSFLFCLPCLAFNLFLFVYVSIFFSYPF